MGIMNALRHETVEFAIGISSGFPLCCVIQYCLDALLHRTEKRMKRHIHGLLYVPCALCCRAHKQTYQRAVTEMFLENGYLEDKDYPLLPNHVKALVICPPKL